LFKDEDKEMRDVYKSSAENPEGNKLLEYLNIDKSIILKWIS
jgi:hypothetical protein